MAVAKAEVVAVVRQIEPDPAAAARLGPDALPHLRKLVLDNDISVAGRAASVATKVNDRRALAVVGLAAESEHPEVRLAAAAEFWRLAEFDVAKVAARALADLDPAVRRRGLRSVASMSPDLVKPALRRRVEVVGARDRHPANRALASAVTARLAGEVTADKVRGALAAGLWVRELMPALGPAALPHLAELAHARDVKVAVNAVALAAALSVRQAAPVVEEATRDRRPQVRAAAAAAAARVWRGKELLPSLLADRNARVREAAFVASVQAKLPGLREIASRLAKKDPDPRVRALAAEYLRRSPPA